MVMSEYELVLKVTNIVHLPGAIHLADFNTHVFGAAAFVSLGATSATKLLSLSLTEGITLMAAGLIGGILPDIDLPASTPSKALFTTLGVIAGLAWMFANLPDYTSLELWIGTITIALLSRFVLAGVFSRFTTHRGALHSLIAALMWGLVACALSWQYFQASALQSWLTGGFLTVGYICHLALDEMYSVNLAGARFKRSFGSALKPMDLKQPRASAMVVLIAVVAAYWCAPPAAALSQLAERYGDWQTMLIPQWLLLRLDLNVQLLQ